MLVTLFGFLVSAVSFLVVYVWLPRVGFSFFGGLSALTALFLVFSFRCSLCGCYRVGFLFLVSYSWCSLHGFLLLGVLVVGVLFVRLYRFDLSCWFALLGVLVRCSLAGFIWSVVSVWRSVFSAWLSLF